MYCLPAISPLLNYTSAKVIQAVHIRRWHELIKSNSSYAKSIKLIQSQNRVGPEVKWPLKLTEVKIIDVIQVHGNSSKRQVVPLC
jgi:hypothetical protein